MDFKTFSHIISFIMFQFSVTAACLFIIGFSRELCLFDIFYFLILAIIWEYYSDSENLGISFTEFIGDGYNPHGVD